MKQSEDMFDVRSTIIGLRQKQEETNLHKSKLEACVN